MPIFCPEPLTPMKSAAGSKVHRRPLERNASLSLSVWLAVVLLAVPCGAQTPAPAPPVQNQLGQSPQAELNVGGSGQSNVGPTSAPASGVGSSASSSLGKRFGSAGRGLPGMPGGPPMKGSMGSQDPSGRYMTPPTIPPLLCDPAINIPC
jgi:hypothetical protein